LTVPLILPPLCTALTQTLLHLRMCGRWLCTQRICSVCRSHCRTPRADCQSAAWL